MQSFRRGESRETLLTALSRDGTDTTSRPVTACDSALVVRSRSRNRTLSRPQVAICLILCDAVWQPRACNAGALTFTNAGLHSPRQRWRTGPRSREAIQHAMLLLQRLHSPCNALLKT